MLAAPFLSPWTLLLPRLQLPRVSKGPSGPPIDTQNSLITTITFAHTPSSALLDCRSHVSSATLPAKIVRHLTPSRQLLPAKPGKSLRCASHSAFFAADGVSHSCPTGPNPVPRTRFSRHPLTPRNRLSAAEARLPMHDANRNKQLLWPIRSSCRHIECISIA